MASPTWLWPRPRFVGSTGLGVVRPVGTSLEGRARLWGVSGAPPLPALRSQNKRVFTALGSGSSSSPRLFAGGGMRGWKSWGSPRAPSELWGLEGKGRGCSQRKDLVALTSSLVWGRVWGQVGRAEAVRGGLWALLHAEWLVGGMVLSSLVLFVVPAALGGQDRERGPKRVSAVTPGCQAGLCSEEVRTPGTRCPWRWLSCALPRHRC